MASGENTPICVGFLALTMVDLRGNGLSQIWKKTAIVAYEDVLKKFDDI